MARPLSSRVGNCKKSTGLNLKRLRDTGILTSGCGIYVEIDTKSPGSGNINRLWGEVWFHEETDNGFFVKSIGNPIAKPVLVRYIDVIRFRLYQILARSID